MRYLVTGGAGFIGSHLVEALLERGDDVLVIDDLSSGSRANLSVDRERLRFVEGTVLDAALVLRCMAEVDACFHLAASVGVRQIVGDPLRTLLNNVRGTDVVLSAAAAAGRRLLFGSTSEVYGRNVETPLRETSDRVLGTPDSLRWSYGSAKAVGEAMAFAYVSAGADMTCARLFNTVGPRQGAAHGMVLPRFVLQALEGHDLTVYGSGRQVRCFMHVHDAVDGLLRLMDVPDTSGRAFNVGSGPAVSVLELAERVIAMTGSASQIAFVPYERVYGSGFEEPEARSPDTTLIRETTGWTPRRSLDDAIRDTVAALPAPV
jgi:UDP-glucose 4-epimerase